MFIFLSVSLRRSTHANLCVFPNFSSGFSRPGPRRDRSTYRHVVQIDIPMLFQRIRKYTINERVIQRGGEY